MEDGIHAASGVCRSSGPADRSEGHKGRQPCDGRGIQGRGCGGAGRWDDCARDALRGPIVRPARRAAVAQVWRRARVRPAFHPRPDRAYSPRSARPSSTSNHRSDEQVLDQAKALVALVRLLARLAAREAWDDGRARPHDPPHGTPKVRLAWSWWSDGFAGLGRLAGSRGGVGGSLLQIGLMYIIIVVFVRCGTQRAVFISFA